MKILAVTACPSGVAHTYMSAEAIQKACEKRGIECKVETQGQIGLENEITKADLVGADAVIFSNDVAIKNAWRFKGIPTVKISVSELVRNADSIVATIQKKLGK